MKGYQITFFTQQDRLHQNQNLSQWLVQQAMRFGFHGATLIGAIQGFGHDKNQHAINMFDYSDQPVQVVMVLQHEEMERFFGFLTQEKVNVFYTKAEVELGNFAE